MEKTTNQATASDFDEIVVIGAGVLGLLTSLELLRRGKQVALVDRNIPGRAASWAGGGILSPLYPWLYPSSINLLSRASQALYRQLEEHLLAYGLDPEIDWHGMLTTGVDVDQVQRWSASHDERYIPGVSQAFSEVLAMSDADGSVFAPHLGSLRNPRLLKALSSYLRNIPGLRLMNGVEASALRVQRGRVTGLSTSAGDLLTKCIVNCAGAWSSTLMAGLRSPNIAPVKGQMIAVQGPPGWLPGVVLSHGKYLIPRRDGLILVGSTLERVGYDISTSDEAAQTLFGHAVNIAPGVADFPIKYHWAGIRPEAPGGIPFICRHPEIKGLYLNTGHYRNGLCTAPASAKLMAQLICGEEPFIDPSPYAFDAPRVEPS